MGRPPSNGGPSFRFNQSEIAEMEAILQAHKVAMPAREVLVSLAEKFSNSEERSGKIEVHMKQVWNWFQNRRYAIRAKAAKSPGKLNITQMTRDDSTMVKGVPQATQPHAAFSATVRTMPQAPQHPTVPSAAVRTFPQAPQHPAAFSGRVADNSQMEYEAKSARDGAWYDVSTFLSHRSLETGDPEVLVRFAGFGAEEDEWVNVRKNVRQRSLPCESSECVAVLPADLILCFQEGKEQALYFDAHVLDAQRRRHDVRGCRCRFLVRYDHDQSEEIVALRKICRRPETDYRLQQLHAVNESLSANQNKNGANNIHTVSTLRVYPPAEVQPKQLKVEPVVPPAPAEVPQKHPRVDSTVPAPLPEVSQSQFKVEPMVLAPAVVPQNQQRVQPAPPPEVPHLHKVETQPPQKVEPVGTFPSAQASVEPKKVEMMVPLPSPQDSAAKAHNIEAVVPTHSDDVPPKSHVPTEVSVEPHKVEADASSGIAKQEMQAIEATVDVVMAETSKDDHEAECAGSGEVPQSVGTVVVPLTEEHQKAEAAPSGEVSQAVVPSAEVSPTVVEAPPEPHKGEPVVAEAQKESMVSGSSGEVPAELHEVQPAVPYTSAPEAIETKPEESVVLISTKAEEAVVPVAETEQPEVSEIMENKQDAETGKENKVEDGAATVDMEEG